MWRVLDPEAEEAGAEPGRRVEIFRVGDDGPGVSGFGGGGRVVLLWVR